MTDTIYIITGVGGFLGNTIAKKLLKQGEIVRGLIFNPSEKEIFVNENIDLVLGDMRDPKSIIPLFENINQKNIIVIHTASIVSISSKINKDLYDVNVVGVKNILEICKKYHVKRLIYVSSVHAIPEGTIGNAICEVSSFSPDLVHGAYAKTKAESSQLVLDSTKEGLDCCIVHPSGIIGCGDYGHTHLNQFVIDYLNGHLTACVNGGYDFVDVSDVADSIISCVDKGVSGECYILSNRYYTIKEILDLLHKISGKPQIRTVLPLWFARLTAPLAESYYRIRKQPPLYTAYSLYTLKSNSSFSHKKATEQLGFYPRKLDETMTEMVQWLLNHNRFK